MDYINLFKTNIMLKNHKNDDFYGFYSYVMTLNNYDQQIIMCCLDELSLENVCDLLNIDKISDINSYIAELFANYQIYLNSYNKLNDEIVLKITSILYALYDNDNSLLLSKLFDQTVESIQIVKLLLDYNIQREEKKNYEYVRI